MLILANMKRKIAPVVALGLTTTLVGCASFTTSDAKSAKKDSTKSWFSFKKEKEYQIPQNLNVVWTYDILTLPGKPATRGFGGRFYFYNEKTQAIPVDGELMVYGFDDTTGTVDERDLSQAAKRFKFTAEQLTSHFSEGQLGASYSVWIPWDVAPGEEKKIMLIPTFIAKDGRLVKGAAATVNLPGKKRTEEVRTIMQISTNSPLTDSSATSVSNALATQTNSTERSIMSIPVPGRRAAPQLDQSEVAAALERLQAAGIEQQMQLQKSYAEAAAQLQTMSQQPVFGDTANSNGISSGNLGTGNPAAINSQSSATLPLSAFGVNASSMQNGAGVQTGMSTTSDVPNKIEFKPYFQPPQASNLTPSTNLTPRAVQVPTIGVLNSTGAVSQ